jgi:hypothetical protein
MKTVLLTAVLVLATAFSAHAQDMVGDWQGTLMLDTPAELRIVLHVTKSDDGHLKATMDSPDQNIMGMPVNNLNVQNSKLTFTVDAARGSYDGKFKSNGTIAGYWTQGEPEPLDFKRQTIPIKTVHKPTTPSDIDGAWAGTLNNGVQTLHIVFHITNTEDGLMATMDSPDQRISSWPATGVTRKGSTLKLELKQVGGGFEGRINKDHTVIDGNWSQGGGILSLSLKRVKEAAASSGT